MSAEDLSVRVVRAPNGCLEWTGGCDSDGYGIVKIDGHSRRAHRAVWELANGPIPIGLVVRHFVCDNPPCLDLDHLRLGTVADNNRDRDMKGRAADRRGELCPTAKLTWPQVGVIRDLLAQGSSHSSIARQFGVSRKAISKIANSLTWKESA